MTTDGGSSQQPQPTVTEDMAGIPRVPLNECGPGTSWVTPFESHLMAENRRLRRELHALDIAPLPTPDVPGGEVWTALMEDLRDDGWRFKIRYHTTVLFGYEPPATEVVA